MPRLYAEIDTRNTGSVRLVAWLTMTRTGVTKQADCFKGASSNAYLYSISQVAWNALQDTGG